MWFEPMEARWWSQELWWIAIPAISSSMFHLAPSPGSSSRRTIHPIALYANPAPNRSNPGAVHHRGVRPRANCLQNMPLYRITVAYDGTGYQGWQVQPKGPTIQGRIQECLERMAGHPVNLVGAGRTDAGVHARAQVAHVQLEISIPPDGLLKGLNSLLPEDIRVRQADHAPEGFHARYSAKSKTYHYYLDRSPVALPFRSRFTHHYPHPLEQEAMEKAAALFLGRHDFLAFAAS